MDMGPLSSNTTLVPECGGKSISFRPLPAERTVASEKTRPANWLVTAVNSGSESKFSTTSARAAEAPHIKARQKITRRIQNSSLSGAASFAALRRWRGAERQETDDGRDTREASASDSPLCFVTRKVRLFCVSEF